MSTQITSLAALRELYPQPAGRTLLKQLAALDAHCERFIALSPFVVLATSGADGRADASPRGGAPGFVKVRDARTLLIPDAPGNNRLDSKAFMRSGLWKPESQVARDALPSMGQMMADQTGIAGPIETQEEMERRYAASL